LVPAWFPASRPGRELGRGRAVSTVVLAAALAAAATACSSSSSSGTAAAVTSTGASASSASASSAGASASASAADIGIDPLTGASATALLAKAVADTKASPSLVVKAAHIPDGTAGQTISIDLTIVQKVGCQGAITESNAGSLQLVVRDGFLWMKPSNGFYATLKFSQAERALVADKWIKDKSTDSQLGSFADTCNVSSLLGSITPTGTPYVATPTTYEGQSAYEFIASGQPGYAYVIDSATPTLAELNIPGKTGGLMTFTVSGTPLTITEPSAAESIDGSAFGF
jgi:hypothetical protein